MDLRIGESTEEIGHSPVSNQLVRCNSLVANKVTHLGGSCSTNSPLGGFVQIEGFV